MFSPGRYQMYEEGSFFTLVDGSESCDVLQFPNLWEDIFHKVRETTGGEILFGSAIGSRLYNINEAHSDLDLFLIYQVPADAFMEQKAVEAFFKSKDNEAPDYTAYELASFCNLLLSRDSRAIEVLATASEYKESSAALVYFIAPEFQHVVDNWQKFFHAQLIANKYISEFSGVKGIKKLQTQFETLQKLSSGDQSTSEITQLENRIQKGLYINHRLLYQARKCLASEGIIPKFPIVENQRFNVFNVKANEKFHCYYQEDDPVRHLLLDIRRGTFKCPFETHILFLEEECASLKEIINISKNEKNSEELITFVDDLLIQMRLTLMKKKYVQLREYNFSLDLLDTGVCNVNLPDCPKVPGNYLILYQKGERKEGIYFPYLPLRFVVNSKKYIPNVINSNGWTIYEINRWLEQIDKGNPNLSEFLLNCTNTCDFIWAHPQWNIFLNEFKSNLITTASVNGCFVAVQQTAKKLHRGGKVSKKKWKARKVAPTPVHLIPFNEQELPFVYLVHFLDKFMKVNRGRQEIIPFDQIGEFTPTEELSEVMARLRDSEEEWKDIFPPRLLELLSDNISQWMKETYLHLLASDK